jgi:hypothetical protein
VLLPAQFRPAEQLATGTALIVIVLLSLGIGGAIWLVVIASAGWLS